MTALPLAIGWIAGNAVRIVILWKAALLEGYEAGRRM